VCHAAARSRVRYGPQAVADAISARTECYRKGEEARGLHQATFPPGMLTGTGSETWTELWEAARRFSQDGAYPDQAFPVVENGAHCVLCQQNLDHAASDRLKRFEAFVVSTTERELRKLRETFVQTRKNFTDLGTTTEAIDDTVKEIRIEHESLADAITAAIETNEKRRKAVVLALSDDKDLADCPDLVSVAHQADALAEQIESRIKTLRAGASNETRTRMTAEAQQLIARKLLAKHEQTILDEIERKKQYAAYGLCIEETKTQTITQKSTAVTKTAVSKKLKQSFQDELEHLGFRHVEVELREAGGADGVLYHKLVLARAPGVELRRVVSEGEQRCLSIAAFFAELSTADDPSGIVFDDPVSSLDYRWREGVARRLVQESKTRQVIVFTHDVVFLLHLKRFAKELNVDQFDQHVQHLASGAGVCVEELPWVALPVSKKIGYLKNDLQAAAKLFREGHQAFYEKDAKYLYGLLREAWERALEEVLLNGIVERFRPGVQTQHVATIADITLEDCRTLDAAMTKCSRWLPGHDQAAAARAAVPEPTELKGDIETLQNWVAAIRQRRSN
jgi:energy-coupling factor transporter ATP-binding protein EcfA2